MADRIERATLSRDSHLAIRRVERQQALIERLHAARGEHLPLAALARDLGASERTLTRDVDRLRSSGVPIEARRGGGGGVRLPSSAAGPRLLELDVPEIAALMTSLAALGPSATDSSASAMHKLTEALREPPR